MLLKLNKNPDLTTPHSLKLIGSTIAFLKELDYPDPERVGKEIVLHCNSDEKEVEKVLYQLKENKPLAYILGFEEFCGLRFAVSGFTLIPRIETEKLVEVAVLEAKKLLKQSSGGKLHIIDVGTGSGAIICSVANALRDFSEKIRFTATDISADALDVAKGNNPDLDIQFIHTNLVEGLEIDRTSPTLICANLPYIQTHLYERLDASVHDFEPKLALDGGIAGLDSYIELWKQISALDINKFLIISEMDPEQTEPYIKIADDFVTGLTHEVIKDQFDVDRFVLSRYL